MVPSSRRGKKPPVRRKGGRAGLPARESGRHVVRGRQSSPTLEVRLGGTGKAGENGQHSGEVGRPAQPGTRPSAPECGDTLQALGGRPASDLGWESSSKTGSGGRHRLGHRAGRTPPHGDGSMYSQANVRVESVLRPPLPERCRP